MRLFCSFNFAPEILGLLKTSDGPVGAWRVWTLCDVAKKDAGGGERGLKVVPTLEWCYIDEVATKNGEDLWFLDMALGGERIVSGGITELELTALGEEEPRGNGDDGGGFGVHIWTRSRSSVEGCCSVSDVVGFERGR